MDYRTANEYEMLDISGIEWVDRENNYLLQCLYGQVYGVFKAGQHYSQPALHE